MSFNFVDSEKCLHIHAAFETLGAFFIMFFLGLSKSHNRKCFYKSQTRHIQSISVGDRQRSLVNALQ